MALALSASPSTATAATVTFDATLASPSANPLDIGWYNGGGPNPQDGFTVVTNNGIEIAARAKQRNGPALHTTDNVYHVPTGAQPGNPTRAWWNYEWSIDLQPGEVGNLLLDGIQASFTIENLTQGTSATVNPLTYWDDNATWGPGGKVNSTAGTKVGLLSTQWGAQQSGNPTFTDFPLFAGYNMNNNDYFRFTMSVLDNGRLLASNSIDVAVGDAQVPVPEPGSMILLGTGAVGLIGYRRRKQAA